MCEERLFGPSSQEVLVMRSMVSSVCCLFSVSRVMMSATVPNMDLIEVPFVLFLVYIWHSSLISRQV